MTFYNSNCDACDSGSINRSSGGIDSMQRNLCTDRHPSKVFKEVSPAVDIMSNNSVNDLEDTDVSDSSIEEPINRRYHVKLVDEQRKNAKQQDRINLETPQGRSLYRIQKKMVQFSTVEVRQYPMILGDNPAVSRGPSVTIDWIPFSRSIVNVDLHVRMTPEPRRKPVQMAMPLYHREFLLRQTGYTRNELLEATKQTNIIKAQRSATVRKLQMQSVEELGESFKGRFKKKFFKKKR